MGFRGLARLALVVLSSFPAEARGARAGSAFVTTTIWERVRDSGERKGRLAFRTLRAKIGKGRPLSPSERESLDDLAARGVVKPSVRSGLLVLDSANRGEFEKTLETLEAADLSPGELESGEKLRLARLFARPKWTFVASLFYEALEARAFGLDEWRMIGVEKFSIRFFSPSDVFDSSFELLSGDMLIAPYIEILEAGVVARATPMKKIDVGSDRANELLSILERPRGRSGSETKLPEPHFAPLVRELLGAALLEVIEASLAKKRYESIIEDHPELEGVYRERIAWLDR